MSSIGRCGSWANSSVYVDTEKTRIFRSPQAAAIRILFGVSVQVQMQLTLPLCTCRDFPCAHSWVFQISTEPSSEPVINRFSWMMVECTLRLWWSRSNRPFPSRVLQIWIRPRSVPQAMKSFPKATDHARPSATRKRTCGQGGDMEIEFRLKS